MIETLILIWETLVNDCLALFNFLEIFCHVCKTVGAKNITVTVRDKKIWAFCKKKGIDGSNHLLIKTNFLTKRKGQV